MKRKYDKKILGHLNEAEIKAAVAANQIVGGWGNSFRGLCPEGAIAKLNGAKFSPDTRGQLWPISFVANDFALASTHRIRLMKWLGFEHDEQEIFDAAMALEKEQIYHNRATYGREYIS